MGCQRTVIWAGWKGVPPRGAYETPRLVALEALPAALAPGPVGTVLVLGDAALRDLRPERLAEHAVFPFCIAFAVPAGSSPELVAAWARSRVAEPVSPERLAGRIAEAIRVPVRVAVPESIWVPPRRRESALAEESVRRLPALRSPSPYELCRRLGVPGHVLRRACEAAFGVSPRALVQAYLVAVTRRARALGWTEEAIARSLGLEDARSLRRLFRRQGRRLPARGASAGRQAELFDSSPLPAIHPLDRPRRGS